MKKIQLYLKIFLNLVLFSLALVFLLFVVPKLIGFFLPFVIGWMIAMIANPLVRFMEKRIKIVRKHSSAIIIVLVILVVVGIMYGVIYYLVIQISSLIHDIPQIVASIQQLFENASQRLQKIYEVLPISMQDGVDEIAIKTQNMLQNLISETGTSKIGDVIGDIAKNIVVLTLDMMITILAAYFFIKERDNLAATVKKSMPEQILKGYGLIMENIKMAFGGYIKAQFKLMGIITVILFIGFEIMQVGYSFLFALLIAFLDFLPLLGTGSVLWPWAIIELFANNIPAAICLMVIYLVCQIVRQILQPKMVGDSIGISPFATLFFMYVGYRLYGGLGLIFGIPAGMILIKFYRIGVFNRLIRGFQILIHDINEFRKF